MVIRVIRYYDWEDWCEENNIEMGVCQLTDEQFMKIYNWSGTDWEFDNIKDFCDEFNTDGPYAPMPSDHIIRFFENE